MIDKTSSNLQLFVQTIRNKIDSYNPPLNEDEIVRCMYLMLGMKAVFDPTFTFGGGGQRIEHINRRKRLNYLDKITEDEEWSVICKDLDRFMSYFGQCFDVDIKVVSSKDEFKIPFKPYARKLRAEAIHSKIENVEVISSMKRTIPGVFFFSGRLFGPYVFFLNSTSS